MTRKHKKHNSLRSVKITRIIRQQEGANAVFVAECTEGAIRVGVVGWNSVTSKLPQYLEFAAAAPAMTEADFEAGAYKLMTFEPQTTLATRIK